MCATPFKGGFSPIPIDPLTNAVKPLREVTLAPVKPAVRAVARAIGTETTSTLLTPFNTPAAREQKRDLLGQ